MLGLAAQLEQEECAAQDVVNYFACHECRSCVTASGNIHELHLSILRQDGVKFIGGDEFLFLLLGLIASTKRNSEVSLHTVHA